MFTFLKCCFLAINCSPTQTDFVLWFYFCYFGNIFSNKCIMHALNVQTVRMFFEFDFDYKVLFKLVKSQEISKNWWMLRLEQQFLALYDTCVKTSSNGISILKLKTSIHLSLLALNTLLTFSGKGSTFRHLTVAVTIIGKHTELQLEIAREWIVEQLQALKSWKKKRKKKEKRIYTVPQAWPRCRDASWPLTTDNSKMTKAISFNIFQYRINERLKKSTLKNSKFVSFPFDCRKIELKPSCTKAL